MHSLIQAHLLICMDWFPDIETVLMVFTAADKLSNAAMWLVVHMTYANRVKLDGSSLEEADFKPNPQGHTGGSLNMVPAYIGYVAANALAGKRKANMYPFPLTREDLY